MRERVDNQKLHFPSDNKKLSCTLDDVIFVLPMLTRTFELAIL